MPAELTIQIIGHNGAAHLARAVEALKRIPKDEVVMRYIDNASTDDSVAIVRRALPEADIVQLPKNRGYTGGHNFGLSLCTTPLVLLHDQDVVIDWQGIKKLLEAFRDEKVAGVQGKLYRANSIHPLPLLYQGGEENSSLDKGRMGGILDTAGIVQTLSLNGKDRGANEVDRGQFDEPKEIFGVQGACALYRMEALLTAATPGESSPMTLTGESARLEILDEDFFAYKDDVDLGWRLTQAGWKIAFRPVVIGTHARTLGKRGVGGWGMAPKSIYARLKSPRTALSLRNYIWMIAKNVSVGQLLWHSPFIVGRLLTFLGFSLAYPPLFSAWAEAGRGLPKMLAKRL